MRISGGTLGGRTIAVPKSNLIRPTQDRVREALFSMLMTSVPGADFLDLFAGSGSVGIEALSRGASSVTFVESNRRHAEVLKSNLKELGISSLPVNCVVADVYRWLAGYVGGGFDIVFADPPYALGEERGYIQVLATLSARGVVRPGGVFIAEMTSVQLAEATDGWQLFRDRTYGKTRLCVWRREMLVATKEGEE